MVTSDRVMRYYRIPMGVSYNKSIIPQGVYVKRKRKRNTENLNNTDGARTRHERNTDWSSGGENPAHGVKAGG